MGGLARCGPSPFFQSLLMRLSAAMLAAVVDGPLGFSVKVDDGKMELAAIVGELSFVSEMQQLTLCDGVKESSSCSPISSCNKGTKSFLKNVEISGWKDMFPKFEQSGLQLFDSWCVARLPGCFVWHVLDGVVSCAFGDFCRYLPGCLVWPELD